MAIETYTFRKGPHINWQWPLNMAVVATDKQMLLAIRQSYYVREFTYLEDRIFSVAGITGYLSRKNIILFAGGLEGVNSNQAEGADIVLIFEKDSEKFASFGRSETRLDTLQEIARRFDAAGVFVFTLPQHYTPAAWLNDLIFDVCHNGYFFDIFRNITPGSYILYNPDLNWSGPVSQSLDKLIDKLRRMPSISEIVIQQVHDVSTPLPSGTFSSHQLAQILSDGKKSMRYYRESGDATYIKNLALAIDGSQRVQMTSPTEPSSPSGSESELPPLFKQPGWISSPSSEPESEPQTESRSPLEKLDSDELWFPSPTAEPEPPEKLPPLRTRSAPYKGSPAKSVPPPPQQRQQGGWIKYFKKIFQPGRKRFKSEDDEFYLEDANATGSEDRATVGASAPAQAAQPAEEEKRYLQAQLSKEQEPEHSVENFLEPESTYTASINIGHKKTGYINSTASFNDGLVFENPASTEEPIEINFIADGNNALIGTLILPKQGSSQNVVFKFTTGTATESFCCNIIAVHKNRVIQWIALKAAVAAPGTAVQGLKIVAETVICTRQNLSNLADRPEFGGSFIVGDASSGESIMAIKMNKPLQFNSSDGTKDRMDKIKGLIESAALDPANYPEELLHINNVNLLRGLALHGERLFQGFTDGTDIIGPLQIIAYRSDFAPVNFVYSFGPPKRDAGLCEHAAEALLEGKCRDCFNKYEIPATHICPFGFWGFSKVIEYHTLDRDKPAAGYADFTLSSEPSFNRNVLHILQDTIHGSSTRVDARQSDSRAKILAAIEGCSSKAHDAHSWDQWVELTHEFAPDSIILVVHTEKDEYDNNIEIENDMLVQSDLSDKYICAAKRAVAIVIGCNVADVGDQGFDIGSEFIRKGASLVISNFTKIRGGQAAVIITELTGFLKQQAGKDLAFGEVILKLKQYLLAKGIVVVMSLVTYGDADWKVRLEKPTNTVQNV